MTTDARACIADDELLLIFEGRLSPAEQARVDHHLDHCPRCFDLLAELARGLPSAPDELSQDSEPGAANPSISGVLSRGALIQGRYQILELAGVGGMGVIYAAYDHTLDRRVALKVVRRDRRPEDIGTQAEARLIREARTLARLSHPNIVVVYDVAQGEEGVVIAMELVAGRTLRTWLEGSPSPSREQILDVFVGAGRGLAAAHAAGVVHRDFKPDNGQGSRNLRESRRNLSQTPEILGHFRAGEFPKRDLRLRLFGPVTGTDLERAAGLPRSRA